MSHFTAQEPASPRGGASRYRAVAADVLGWLRSHGDGHRESRNHPGHEARMAAYIRAALRHEPLFESETE